MEKVQEMQMEEGVWTSDPQGNPVFIPLKNKTAWEPQQTPLNHQQVNTELQTRPVQPPEQSIKQIQEDSVEHYQPQRQEFAVPDWIRNQRSFPHRFPNMSPRPMFRPLSIGRDTPFGMYQQRSEKLYRPLTGNVLSRNIYHSPLFNLRQYTETEVDNQTGEIVSQRKRFFQPRIVARI
jgi:hypothetical protein